MTGEERSQAADVQTSTGKRQTSNVHTGKKGRGIFLGVLQMNIESEIATELEIEIYI